MQRQVHPSPPRYIGSAGSGEAKATLPVSGGLPAETRATGCSNTVAPRDAAAGAKNQVEKIKRNFAPAPSAELRRRDTWRYRLPDLELVLWGENGVGKSALMFRMMMDRWEEAYVRHRP